MVPLPSSDSQRALALPLRMYFKFSSVPVLSMVPLNVMWFPSLSPPAMTILDPLTVTWKLPSFTQSEPTLDVPTRCPLASVLITIVIVKGEKCGCRDSKVPDQVPVTSTADGCAETAAPELSGTMAPCMSLGPANEMSNKRSERNISFLIVIVILHWPFTIPIVHSIWGRTESNRVTFSSATIVVE